MRLLACDLGGTRMKIGVVQNGRLLAYAVKPANSHQGLAPQLPKLKATWRRLLGELDLEASDCAGISMAFPSLIDPATDRVVLQQDKYADAAGIDLPRWGRTEFDLPLVVDNDARMALMGEWRHGAGRDSQNLVMMILGTGVGTSAVVEGRLLRGCHGQAGVLGGHLTLRYGGRRCSCGNTGCAEAEASTAFLNDMAADLPEWKTSPLRQADTLDYALVFEQAARGEACAVLLRDQSLHVWSALAVNLIHAYDPEVIILSGGLLASEEVIVPAIRTYVLRHAITPWGTVRVVPSELGDHAALIAGEWLLNEKFPDLLP